MDPNPHDSCSLEGLRFPLQGEHLEAAKAMAADNKGAQWGAGHALFLLASDPTELRRALGAFLWELEDIPTSTISYMTGYSGRELREIVEDDPISLFSCLQCSEPIMPKDRPHLMKLRRELRLICVSRVGDVVVEELLCQRCSWGWMQLLEEEKRLRRRARQARLDQIKRLPHVEYLFTREWQSKRTFTLARAGYRCQICGTKNARLDVHHNTYDNLGDERPQDLVVLCEHCHGLFHGKVQDAS